MTYTPWFCALLEIAIRNQRSTPNRVSARLWQQDREQTRITLAQTDVALLSPDTVEKPPGLASCSLTVQTKICDISPQYQSALGSSTEYDKINAFYAVFLTRPASGRHAAYNHLLSFLVRRDDEGTGRHIFNLFLNLCDGRGYDAIQLQFT